MMRKRVWLMILAIVVLVAALGVLYACESYDADPLKKVGDKNAEVQSNGGLVVKQGGYLYFVNGYSGYLTKSGEDNWFGNVTKGAIVRVSYKADGTLGNDYTVVVPKSVMASSEDVGFSIYGNWIYYVSPCTDEDRSGKVQTDTLQFLRTKLDGTGTQLILNWDNTSVRYKYTSSALVYYDSANSKLYSKTFSGRDKSGFDEEAKGNCIADKVASVYFLKNETYNPKSKEIPVGDYILYTKNSSKALQNNNMLYITDPNGKNTKTLIGESSYKDAKYSISLITCAAEGNNLEIYYTKTSYVGTSSSGTSEGTYAYRFENKNFTFDESKEVKLSTGELTSLKTLGYGKGAVYAASDAVIYSVDFAETDQSKQVTTTAFGSLSLDGFICLENGNFYYLKDSKLFYYPIDKESNAHFAYTTGEVMMTSFIKPEYFDGYIYFILDDDYDYLARIKLADIDVYSGKDAEIVRVAKPTAADKAAIAAEAAD